MYNNQGTGKKECVAHVQNSKVFLTKFYFLIKFFVSGTQVLVHFGPILCSWYLLSHLFLGTRSQEKKLPSGPCSMVPRRKFPLGTVLHGSEAKIFPRDRGKYRKTGIPTLPGRLEIF